MLAEPGSAAQAGPQRPAQGAGGPPAPGPGARLRQGSTVVLAVSAAGGAAANNVIVPGVVGLRAGMARTVLAQAGLSSGLAYTNGGRRAGSPPRARRRRPAAQGSYVTLVVSRRS